MPSSNNANWKLVDNAGNKVNNKTTFAENGANGTIRRNSDDEIIADVVQGGSVFREKYTKAVVRTTEDFADDMNKNFDMFDEILAVQLSKGKADNGMLDALRAYFKKQGKDLDDIRITDVRNYRTSNNLTWHECTDRRTAQLVDSSIHSTSKGGAPHSGGRSEARQGER